MPLTIAQRRKQNQINAQKSTGPTTQEGKNISRGNSLIHGLAAQVLMLPDEQLDGVEAQANAWTEACQPQGHDEETLVGQLTLTSLRLARIARAEAATLSEQVRNARTDWHKTQEYKLVECTRLLRTDPAIALIDLKSFGAGVEWMIEKWLGLQDAFKRFECWNTLALIKDAIRLQGGDPEQMRYEPLPMQEFALVACSCVEGHSRDPRVRGVPEPALAGVGRPLSELDLPAGRGSQDDRQAHRGADCGPGRARGGSEEDRGAGPDCRPDPRRESRGYVSQSIDVSLPAVGGIEPGADAEAASEDAGGASKSAGKGNEGGGEGEISERTQTRGRVAIKSHRGRELHHDRGQGIRGARGERGEPRDDPPIEQHGSD